MGSLPVKSVMVSGWWAQTVACVAPSGTRRLHGVHAHRIRHALQIVRPPILEGHPGGRSRQSAHGLGYQQLVARRGSADPGRDVDGSSVYVALLRDHVARVDTQMDVESEAGRLLPAMEAGHDGGPRRVEERHESVAQNPPFRHPALLPGNRLAQETVERARSLV